MSYNIMNKRASFQGTISGSIEDMVDIHTNQTINGQKTITDLTASTLLVSNDLTASGIVSASAFYGDGTGLIGVTVNPDGVNTEVQFNADGAFGASPDFTFNTGSSTLTVTGDITASANVSASAFFGDGAGLTNVSTTVNASDLVGSLSASQIDHTSPLTNSAGNLTLKFAAANSGLTDSSGIKLDFGGLGATPFVSTYNVATEDTSGNHFKITLATIGSNINTSATNINAGTLNNARLPSAISVNQVTASTFRVTGKSVINDDVTLTSNKRIYLDGTGNPAFQGPFLYGNTSTMYLDGDDNMYLYHDTRMSIFHGSNRIIDIQGGAVSFDTTVSSSNYISASSYAVAGGTVITPDGDFQGNNAFFNEITASSVISSSAEISASSFHGDGSALTNVSADPQFRYYNYSGYLNVNTGYQWMYSRTNNTGTSNPASSVFLKWMAPGSGSIVRWVITPLNTTDGANGGYVETSFLKNNITQNANTLARTAHVTGAFDITRTIGGVNVSSSVIDWTGTNLTVSGTNAFDPGDTLLFGVKAENNHGDCFVSIIFKIDESIIYP